MGCKAMAWTLEQMKVVKVWKCPDCGKRFSQARIVLDGWDAYQDPPFYGCVYCPRCHSIAIPLKRKEERAKRNSILRGVKITRPDKT